MDHHYVLSLNCAYCGDEDVEYICGHCPHAAYCDKECADKHWKEDKHHEFELESLLQNIQVVYKDDDLTVYAPIPDVELIERRAYRRAYRRGRRRGRRRRRARRKKWVQRAIKHPGSFTRKAKQRGLTPAQFQRQVLAHPNRYDKRTVKQANFRKTLVGF